MLIEASPILACQNYLVIQLHENEMKGVVKMMNRCPKVRIDEKSHHDSDNIVIDVPVRWIPSGVRSPIADRD